MATTEIEVGDRIRVTNYKDRDGKTVGEMTGLLGTVEIHAPHDEYVDALMDDEIAGLRYWFFHIDEIEVI